MPCCNFSILIKRHHHQLPQRTIKFKEFEKKQKRKERPQLNMKELFKIQICVNTKTISQKTKNN
jgi:hypothetical protein